MMQEQNHESDDSDYSDDSDDSDDSDEENGDDDDGSDDKVSENDNEKEKEKEKEKEHIKDENNEEDSDNSSNENEDLEKEIPLSKANKARAIQDNFDFISFKEPLEDDGDDTTPMDAAEDAQGDEKSEPAVPVEVNMKQITKQVKRNVGISSRSSTTHRNEQKGRKKMEIREKLRGDAW
eukprot:TRINITY_DN123_c0_g1_i1.p2 TRINITY_DN123_c0_g1~~TRINITY_DN123_c0_g1_i1.p2  ORF type:complete len:179 (+),score=85.57 TRINITY_DN123_c0_g1_i1:1212-1748(+)